MKKIFIVLTLVGIIKGLTGSGINAGIEKDLSPETIVNNSSSIEPRFSELDGNLFLALQTNKDLNLNEGSVIEFEFKKKKSIRSFHVNDANQDVLDQGEADLLVMIHHDLALSLRSEKLMGIKIFDGDNIVSLEVNDFWQPHNFLTSL